MEVTASTQYIENFRKKGSRSLTTGPRLRSVQEELVQFWWTVPGDRLSLNVWRSGTYLQVFKRPAVRVLDNDHSVDKPLDGDQHPPVMDRRNADHKDVNILLS